MFEIAERPVGLTLYTDAYVVRGTVMTRQRRISDVLNHAEHDFLVVSDVMLDEFGAHNLATRADFAQVNLAAVLFAVADIPVEPLRELRTPKIAETALISVPPFRITGRIHLMPERDLRDALGELVGRFVPVTEATYWSDVVGEAKRSAPMVAVNHARAQILAPYREIDPWAGLDRGAVHAAAAESGTDEGAEENTPAAEGAPVLDPEPADPEPAGD